ncbi:hypothetical protein Tco_1132156 [Tanacetum coccineum]|uniref:Uncharacterized protein n=1 Tax=Tanacetum coccineum TaxID=301880 RepID=A0ABQ5JCI9_9ASTR
MKMLADLKVEQEKTEQKLKALSNEELKAQASQLAAYEAKRKRMLEEYNHYITYTADKLPITKINYKIDKVSKYATMRIERNNQPLSLTVYEKFVLKKLGFSEWIEVHTLASKNKSKANDILLKNLKAKFEWIKTQDEKLGIPPPSKLTAFSLSAAKKKRKGSPEIIKEVFVKEDIVVDGMHRNLIPPPGEEEFHLAITAQLIRTQSAIQRGTLEAKEMFKKMKLTIEARNDVTEDRRIVKENLDGLGQNM